MVPPASNRVPRARSYSGATSRLLDFAYRTFTPFGLSFQICSAINILAFLSGPQPQLQAAGLASFHFARRYFGNRCFFLFLRVLRCFSSPGSLPYVMDWRMDDWSSSRRVSPFRYLRINGYLHLPAAFRSLSRLSSAPSAKASS